VAVIFNPSFPYRLVHTVIAAYLTTALVVGACGRGFAAGQANASLMRRLRAGTRRIKLPARCLAWPMWLPRWSRRTDPGRDQQGLNTLEHQPAKVLADGRPIRSEPERGALDPVRLPSNADGKGPLQGRDPACRIADLKHDPNAPLQGLKDFPRDQWAPWRGVLVRSARWSGSAGDARAGVWSLVARGGASSTTGHGCTARPLVMGRGLRRGDRGMDHDRGRTPARDDLRPAQDEPIGLRHWRRPAVATSLARSSSSISRLFGLASGTSLKLMQKGPQPHEPEMAEAPIRSAGITPAAQWEAAMTVDPTLCHVWAFVIAFRCSMYVCDGRVRPRHRHPVPGHLASARSATRR